MTPVKINKKKNRLSGSSSKCKQSLQNFENQADEESSPSHSRRKMLEMSLKYGDAGDMD